MKIFISATTTPFEACREQLRSDLAAAGHEVRVQQDFQTGTGTLLQRIQDYVSACDRVIVLIGDTYGAEASGDGVPAHATPRSYTQWEYFFAMGERLWMTTRFEPRPLHIYVASESFRQAHGAAESEVLKARQATFARHVEATGQHHAEFSDANGLSRLVLRDLTQIDAQSRVLIDDATCLALAALDVASRSGDPSSAGGEALTLIRRHAPRDAREHRLHRIATWSDPKCAVDSRFTRLTLMLDQGGDAEERRWLEQTESFDDLRAVLAKLVGTAQVMVVLGPPGSGKSTLLRRLEFDLAMDGVGRQASEPGWSFFVSLASYSSPVGQPLPDPQRWLADRWARDFPQVPSFDAILRDGCLTLLLDALNEIPHASREDYAARVDQWRLFVADLLRRAPASRIVFTCRSLDYSELLSTTDLPVPQVRIERLTDDQVQTFLVAYSPNHGATLWHQLEGSPQLDLFRSPYYLRLLIEQSSAEGRIPEGRAALFTRFVRTMLFREVETRNALFRVDGVLTDRDRNRIAGRAWQTPHDLPTRGPLIPSLSAFAFGLQERKRGRETAQVRASFDEAIALLGPNRPADIVAAGVALQVLDDDRRRDEVLFVHQLLQEYFAARAVTASNDVAKSVALARVPWREHDLPPVRFESDTDPLPPVPPTGWEETLLLAGAMVPDAEAFVTALIEVNLPLAGGCASQPDVKMSPRLTASLQHQLLERSRHVTADLRSRIAAARSLAELGDPRFERREGPFADYLFPPFVDIPGGEYHIGSDRGYERPAHPVALERFQMAVFPVTNAEWRLFMAAGGYDEDQWWDTEASKCWRRGDGTVEGPKTQSREDRLWMQQNFSRIREHERAGRLSPKQADEWEAIARRSDAEFESLLDQWFPAGRQAQPALWNDPAFNHMSQPVVGVCWFEARAYCAWLSAQSNSCIALPTEAQWEAAARGEKGRHYAWGDDFDATRCNTFETHVRRTTPIGVFPRGDTPYGLADITGNVCEWTSSAYQPYPYAVGDGREDATRDDLRRVVRGGSWFNALGTARASYRDDGYRPGSRNVIVGFRLVRVSPIR